MVPVRGASTRMRDFLDHLAEGVLPFDAALSLTLVARNIRTAGEVTAMAQEAFKALTGFKWKVDVRDALKKNGLPMNDALAEEFGDTVFVAEEEPFLHPDFLARCRGNVARGRQVYTVFVHLFISLSISLSIYVQICSGVCVCLSYLYMLMLYMKCISLKASRSSQVYFPVPFALFNPSVTYPLFDQEVPHLMDQLVVKEHFGYWKHSRAVAACVSRADLASLLKETRRGMVAAMFKEAVMSKTIKVMELERVAFV